eukprot:gene2537-3140_t
MSFQSSSSSSSQLYKTITSNNNKIEIEIIKDKKINIEEWTSKVYDDGAGAVSTFIGTTRNNFKGKNVIKLEYESYVPMALKEIEKICKFILEQHRTTSLSANDIKHIAVVHRIGDVPVGEISIFIAVSSSHRQASLDAVQYAIDTIKSTVPIWKREYYDDGSIWKDNCEACHFKINNSNSNKHDQHHHQHNHNN